MYARVCLSLLVLALAILVSSAPVDSESRSVVSLGKARRKISLPKPKPPATPPKPPATPPKPPVTPPKPTTPPKPSATVAPPKTSTPAKTSIASPPPTKSSVASSASSRASSAASSAVSSPAASSASSRASSSASSAASSASSSAASSVSSAASSIASSATSSAASSSASASATAASCALPKTKSTRSMLQRRVGIASGTDTPVCGIPFRLGTLPTKCEANDISFTSPLTPITKSANTAGTIAAGTQCDHALELQALKFAMDQSGACRAMDAIIKANPQTSPSAAQQKQSLLSDMFDQINGQGNAFSLDSGVNGAKKLVVQAGLPSGASCSASPSSELKNAVNAYFTDTSINGPTVTLAGTLDNLASTAVNNAEASAVAAINCMPTGSARQRTAKQNAQTAVTNGKALFNGPNAMRTGWQNVLACAAALAT